MGCGGLGQLTGGQEEAGEQQGAGAHQLPGEHLEQITYGIRRFRLHLRILEMI